MSERIPRRQFFNRGLGAGLGVALLPGTGRFNTVTGTIPIIATSHRNQVSHDGITAGYEILVAGGSALDAVENLALIQLLRGSTWEPWPALARACAIPKFAIVAAGLLYVAVGSLALLRARRRPEAGAG